MKRKLFSLIAVVLCVAMIMVGCSSSSSESSSSSSTQTVDEMIADLEEQMNKELGELPEEGKGEKIGVLISATSNEFWATMKKDYEENGEELGIDVQVFEASAEDDSSGQLDVLMSMIPMGFDAIIVSPIDGTNLIPGIVAANKAGIPVVNLGPGVDTTALSDAGGHLDAKITVNFEDQGKMVAEDMVSRLPDGGEVAIIAGLDGASQSTGRVKGATDVFESTDGITVVATQAADWKADKAYEATKDILTANPDVKGIFAANDTMALATVQALQEMGAEDVMVYGVDFTSDAKAAIEDGTMMGSMTYSSMVYTKAALEMAMLLAQGKTFDEPIYLPLTLVTQDNVAQFEGWK